jgi:uncharacterized protein YacL
MNNLILAASQKTEGYIYLESPVPSIFNTVFFVIVGFLIVSCVIAAIISKEFIFLGIMFLGIMITFMVSFFVTGMQQTNSDDTTNLKNFKVWAQERYNLDLTDEQVETLENYETIVVNGKELTLSEPDKLGAYFIITAEYQPPINEYQPEDNTKEGESW